MPVTRQKLEEMTPEELIGQYHSLRDWIQEKRGINFEREPKLGRKELIAIVYNGQSRYIDDIFNHALATSLTEWGRSHPGAVLFTSGE